MKVSYNWLQEYFDDALPEPKELARLVTAHSYEVEEVVEKEGDTILDIDVLPNRGADSLSHLGIAREISAILNIKLEFPKDSLNTDASIKTSGLVTLEVENDHLVPRASKRLAFDVKVGSSPDWLKERLAVLGQRSINNIVDVTNWVVLETGQPVHAFDYDKISGVGLKKIYIRGAKEGEKITVLDDKEFELPEGALVIADEDKALDIAGVKGGKCSGIDENTTRVLLSVCNFNPVQIRKTSRTLNLLTDASKRFEQGISPEMVRESMDRFSALIQKVSGARIAEDVLDEYPRPKGQYRTGIAVSEVNKLLGIDLNEHQIEKVLESLGFKWEKVSPREKITSLAKEYLGVPYKYGASITMDAPNAFDCSSFSAYIYSFAGLSIPRMTVDQLVYGEEILKENLKPGDLVFARNGEPADTIEVELVDTGRKISEVVLKQETREFLPGTRLDVPVDHNGIYLGDGKIIHASGEWHKGEVVIEDINETPAFKDIVGYRRILLSEEDRYAVEVPYYRTDIKQPIDLIEEIGRIYGYDNIKPVPLPSFDFQKVNKEFYWSNLIKDVLVSHGFSEVMTYVLREEGEVELLNPLSKDKGTLRNTLSSGLKDSMKKALRYKDALDANTIAIFEIGRVFTKNNEHIRLAITSENEKYTQEAVKVLEEKIGGELKGNMNDGVWELDLASVIDILNDPIPEDLRNLEDVQGKDIKYKIVSAYPYVLRDIALWCPRQVESGEVLKVIKENGGEWLVRTDLFDEFEKEDRVSYAFHLVFQSQEKTLSDSEINEVMDKIYKELEGEGWEIR